MGPVACQAYQGSHSLVILCLGLQMDLSSHGRKRGSKEEDKEGAGGDEERVGKQSKKSDESEESKYSNRKKDRDNLEQNTKSSEIPSESSPSYAHPPNIGHSLFNPLTNFPRPYDLSINIQHERYHPHTDMPPPFSSQHKPPGNIPQMLPPYSSQQKLHSALLVPPEKGVVRSTIASSTSKLPTTEKAASFSQDSVSSSPQQPNHPNHFHKGSLT